MGSHHAQGRRQDDVADPQFGRLPRHPGRTARARHRRQGRSVRRGARTRIQNLPGSGAEERPRHGRGFHQAGLQDRIGRHRQPSYVGRPAHQVPRADRQAGREVPRRRRHHRQQEHGAVRQPFAVPDFGPALRYAGHHHARSEGGQDGLHRRADRPCAPRPRKRGEHRRRAPRRQRLDGRLSVVRLVAWKRFSTFSRGCTTATHASGSTPTAANGPMSRAASQSSLKR